MVKKKAKKKVGAGAPTIYGDNAYNSTVRMSAGLYRKIKKEAKKENTSSNAIINGILSAHFSVTIDGKKSK